MRSEIRRMLLIVTLVMGPAMAAQNYYVSTAGSDSNNGSSTAPWKTITHAAALAQAGWTVHVAPGTYNEGVIQISASGTSSSPITFISDTQWAAKVADSAWHAFYLTGSYIVINGFEVYMTNPDKASDIIDIYGTHEKVVNNYVHELDNTGPSCWGGGAIAGPPSSYLTVTGNTIANVGFSTCDNVNGIYLGGDHLYIANNIVRNVVGNCIQLWPYVSYSQIMNNDVSYCGGSFTNQAGITIGTDVNNQGPLPGSNHNVVDRKIVRNTWFGIRECCSDSGYLGTDEQYLNNDVLNAGTANYYLVKSGATPQNPLSVDPLYVSYSTGQSCGSASCGGGIGNYSLQANSPLIDKGTSSYAPSADFSGAARPQGAGFDIGAYEYTSTSTAPPLPPSQLTAIVH